MGGLQSFGRDQRGSVGIVFALTSTVVFGIIGGAVDFGRALNARATLQAATDAAAIDGAKVAALNVGDPVAAATSLFNLNISSSALGTGSPSVALSSIQPIVSRSGNQVTVTSATSVPTTFLALLGVSDIPIEATAIAQATLEENDQPDATAGDACVLLLDPGKHHSLLVNGSSYVSAPGCEFHVRSNRESEAVMINSNVHFDVKKTCTAGNYRMNGGSQGVVGPVEAHCITVADPFAGNLPVPPIAACTNGGGSTGTRNNAGGTAYMTPGTFCNAQNFNGNIKKIVLAPGVYVLKNSRWTFNGQLSGTGVTIYLADSSSYFQLNGQGSISITAPTSGTFKGILMYEPHNLSNLSQITVNGGSNSAIEGLIYLPSRDMTWNGNSGVQADKLTMVFNSLIINGNTTWRVGRHPDWSFGVPNDASPAQSNVIRSIKLQLPDN